MQNIILFVLSIALLCSCGNNSYKEKKESQGTDIKYDFNVLFVPDLSNRINLSIHPKPIHDTTLLYHILDNVVQLIDLNNRKVKQADIYKFDFVNKSILSKGICIPEQMIIDLSRFGNKVQKEAVYLRDSISNDIRKFKDNIGRVYDYSLTHTAGADLWNYFNETINSSLKRDEVIVQKNKKNNITKKYKDVVVVLTDGYIENSNKAEGYKLDQQLIEKIRKDFITSGSKDLSEFIRSKEAYQIIPTTNKLTGVNVLVLELIDRSLDKNGVALKQPTDFQIMKVVWEEWLKNSGAQNVEIHQSVIMKDDGFKILKKFMEKI